MPRRATHSAVGAAAGMAAALAGSTAQNEGDRVLEVIGGLFGGYVGGVLPDGLDVPITPNHRSVAHGGLAFAALAKTDWAGPASSLRARAAGCTAASAAPDCTPDRGNALLWEAVRCRLAAGFLLGFPAGYASHLALDLFTPRGLPLVG